jgi:hypothetical protein
MVIYSLNVPPSLIYGVSSMRMGVVATREMGTTMRTTMRTTTVRTTSVSILIFFLLLEPDLVSIQVSTLLKYILSDTQDLAHFGPSSIQQPMASPSVVQMPKRDSSSLFSSLRHAQLNPITDGANGLFCGHHILDHMSKFMNHRVNFSGYSC